MTSPIIQIPFLRPDPVHETGFDQPAQMAQIAKLLQARGALALEEEKFQGEQSMAKDRLKFEKDTATAKQQQLDSLKQALQQAFQGVQGGQGGQQGGPQGIMAPGGGQGAPQQPQGGPHGLMGMFGNAAAAFGGAGDPQAAAAMLAQLRPLLLQQQQDAQDAKLREIMTSHGDLSNEDNRRNAQSALIVADPRGPAMAAALGAMYKNTEVNTPAGGITTILDPSGRVLNTIRGPDKVTTMDEMIRQRAPAVSYGIKTIKDIEASDPQSVNMVAGAVAAGKLKLGVVNFGTSMEVLKGLGFTQHAFEYANAANTVVEAMVGLNRMGRGGQYVVDLFKSSIVPLLNEALPNPDGSMSEALKKRQQLRDLQINGFFSGQMGFPAPDQQADQAAQPTFQMPGTQAPSGAAPPNPGGIQVPSPGDLLQSIKDKFGQAATPPPSN